MFNGTLKVRFFINISWRCLKALHCSIGLINSENLLIFKFRNDGKTISSIIKKTRMLADSYPLK